MKKKTMAALALAAGLVLAPLVAVAPASAADDVECVPSAGSPAVAEVSHTDYWYMPVSGSQGRWTHSNRGAFDIYDWTLYYRTSTTQKHVVVEAKAAVDPVTCEGETTTAVTPAAPVWDDPCGLDNASWKPFTQDGVVWEFTTDEEGVVTAAASPAESYSFPAEVQTEWSAADSGEPCVEAAVEVTPEEPVWTCEDGWSYEDTEAYTWEEGTAEGLAYVHAIPAEGYVFPEDAEDVWVADVAECEESGEQNPLVEECDEEPCPAETTGSGTPAATGSSTDAAAPTGSLPATGGGAVNPIVPIGAAVVTLLGAALFIWRRVRA